MRIPEIKVEDYTDPFCMTCGWVVGMKLGDGSPIPCMATAYHRVIFESGGRTMLCSKHKRRLLAARDKRVEEVAQAIAHKEMWSPTGARPLQ